MKNIFRFHENIDTFKTVTLHTIGMRYSAVYEIAAVDGGAEVSQYDVVYRDGEKERQLKKRTVCSADKVLKLMNECRLLSWDGFHGKHPRGVRDGTIFSFDAVINGKNVHADGSQNFPSRYRDFTDGLYEILNTDNSGKLNVEDNKNAEIQ